MSHWSLHNCFFVNDSGHEPSGSSYSIRQAIPKCYKFRYKVRKRNNKKTKSSDDHSCMYQHAADNVLGCQLLIMLHFSNIYQYFDFLNYFSIGSVKFFCSPPIGTKNSSVPLLISKIHVFPPPPNSRSP